MNQTVAPFSPVTIEPSEKRESSPKFQEDIKLKLEKTLHESIMQLKDQIILEEDEGKKSDIEGDEFWPTHELLKQNNEVRDTEDSPNDHKKAHMKTITSLIKRLENVRSEQTSADHLFNNSQTLLEYLAGDIRSFLILAKQPFDDLENYGDEEKKKFTNQLFELFYS